MKNILCLAIILSCFIPNPIFAGGSSTFLYTIIDAHTGKDMADEGVAIYARKSGTKQWNYVGVYSKAYGGKGNINVTYGQDQPANRNNHLLFQREQRAPNIDIKIICEGYRTSVVRNRSHRDHSSKNIFALHK